MNDIDPFPLTYGRGHRHVFASLELKGVLPYSSTKQVDKGKEKVTEHIIVEEEDKHETEQEFQLIDLDDEDEERITSVVIRCKEANISELQTGSDIK